MDIEKLFKYKTRVEKNAKLWYKWQHCADEIFENKTILNY